MTLPSPPTLPPLPFAKLAPSTYLTAHLSSPTPLRPSNRTLLEPRVPNIHTGSLSHAHGSAVIRAGDTSAVCSVRAEILKREDVVDWTPSAATYEEEDERSPPSKRRRLDEKEDIARLNLLVPNVELATGCSPANVPTGSGAPSAAAQVLAQRIETLLHTADIVPLDALRIWGSSDGGTAVVGGEADGEEGEDLTGRKNKKEVKAYWVLYIDIIFLSLNGPAMDIAWLAMITALKNTKLPSAEWDWDAEGVICDPEPTLARGLDLRDLPVVLSLGIFVGDAGSIAEGKGRRRKTWILADLDGFEEALCRETVTIALGVGGRLLRIEKGGGGNFGVEKLKGCVEEAEEWRRRCVDVMNQ